MFHSNLPKTMNSSPVTSILTFCQFSQKCAGVYQPVSLSFVKFCGAGTLLFELQLDDVLEVLLVVGLKLVDKYHRKIH